MPSAKRMKLLLPIKTSKGLVIVQSREEEEEEKKQTDSDLPEGDGDNDEVEFDSDDDTHDMKHAVKSDQSSHEADNTPALTPVEQMALEEAKVKEMKVSIASYAQGVIENPQEKVGNLRQLRLLLADPLCRARPVLADYIAVSLCEVFKDILPSYKIRLATDAEKHQMAKKETKRLRAFEETLLANYKKYLALLSGALRSGGKGGGKIDRKTKGGKWQRLRRGRHKKESEGQFTNRPLAVRCLAQLLGAHPNFNESQELISWLTPCLNSRSVDVSAPAGAAFRQLFSEDRSGEASLRAVKAVCQFAGAACGRGNGRGKVHGELLEVLAGVRLDLPPPKATAEQQSFNRMTHQQKLAKLSRQERKRGKQSAAETAGLEELRGQESANVRARRQQRCAELLLHLYIRVIRARPGARPLAAALSGLNRLALRVNLDLLPDLYKALGDLLDWPDLSAEHSLLVVRTALALVTGEGEALTLDPRRFYLHLYSRMDRLVRCHPDLAPQLSQTLRLALVDRRRHLPPMRPVSFIRRLIASCCGGGSSSSSSAGESALVDLLTCAASLLAVFPRAHFLLEPGDNDELVMQAHATLHADTDVTEADPDLGCGGGGSWFASSAACVAGLRRLSVQSPSARVRQLASGLLRLDFAGIVAASNASHSSNKTGDEQADNFATHTTADEAGVSSSSSSSNKRKQFGRAAAGGKKRRLQHQQHQQKVPRSRGGAAGSFKRRKGGPGPQKRRRIK